MDKKYRSDINIIKFAITRNYELLQFASQELRSNKHVVKIAIDKNFRCLRHADESLLKDKIYILDLVKING